MRGCCFAGDAVAIDTRGDGIKGSAGGEDVFVSLNLFSFTYWNLQPQYERRAGLSFSGCMAH